MPVYASACGGLDLLHAHRRPRWRSEPVPERPRHRARLGPHHVQRVALVELAVLHYVADADRVADVLERIAVEYRGNRPSFPPRGSPRPAAGRWLRRRRASRPAAFRGASGHPNRGSRSPSARPGLGAVRGCRGRPARPRGRYPPPAWQSWCGRTPRAGTTAGGGESWYRAAPPAPSASTWRRRSCSRSRSRSSRTRARHTRRGSLACRTSSCARRTPQRPCRAAGWAGCAPGPSSRPPSGSDSASGRGSLRWSR